MKRWLLAIIVVIALALSATALRHVLKEEANKKREVAYQSALQAYSQNLRPGLTRRDVEKYLRARDITFVRMCCVEEQSALADLVKVGEEDAPWYCSEYYVFVAFEFAATESHQTLEVYDSDVLKKVTIFRQLDGCL
jgi:hypothetical protein